MVKILKNKYYLFLFFILILAAFLRLYRIADYMTFLGDEGRDMVAIYNILHGHFTLLGPTSSVGGFFLGPIYYYMAAPFLFLFGFGIPVGPSIMVAMLSVLTVWLLYFLGSKFFGRFAGLIAAFLYAISPLVITYSHSSWNPNPLPFFTLLTLYILYRGLWKGSNKLLVLSGFLLGILMQLHYLASFVGIIMVIYILVINLFFGNEKKISAKLAAVGKTGLLSLIGFFVGLIPFFAFDFRHGFINIKNIVTFIFHSGNTGGESHFFTTVSSVFFRIFARLLTNYPAEEYSGFLADVWILGIVVFSLISIFLLFSEFSKYKFSERNEKKEFYLLLLIWLFVGIFLFGLYKKPIYDYYFEFLFPLPFLLAGNLLSTFFRKNLALKFLSFLILIFFVAQSAFGWPLGAQPNRQVLQMKGIAGFVMDKADGKPFNFAIITAGNSDWAYRYFFKVRHSDPVVLQIPQFDPSRTTVTGQLFVVCEKVPCAPLGNPLWEIAGFGRAEIAGSWDFPPVKIYKLIHEK